ncbi:phage antirepressor KilAC domain-containing protein [Bacillus sp. FSL W7-1294]|uniref:phage antirepressor KilAC domain-containing protein n=1 Tax=Bacillus TaxID=1386 RepID=UPI00077AD648|nr:MULTISPECIES: phage antirepressor KilAC domain-containing protein [Bacillus cereus group]KXY75835.1 DNA-binding protein [Bacillus cereus]MED2996323.1 phage antirepressor KilAC domain-containing protein [Bacillus tropicus]
MNQLQVFNHQEFGALEVIQLNGKEMFNLENAAWSLGYTKVAKGKTYLRKDRIEKVIQKADISVVVHDGQPYITEDGLYELIFESETQKAKEFRKWVTSEVLPSIRKHGAYMTPHTINALLQDPDLIIGLASQLKQEQQARQVAEQKNLMLTQQIAENASKITYLDQILKSKDTVTVSQIAADYGLSAQNLNKILNKEKIQYKLNDQWLLYANYRNQGYTKSKTVDVTHSDGSKSVKMNTRWTQKGRLFIHELLTKRGIIPEMDREAV